MASILSGDVESLREAIVEPLVGMMSRLSGEMRKNLSEEVSGIREKLEEVSYKVDYLISKAEGNNSKGEKKSIPDSHLFSQQFKHSLLQESEDSDLEDIKARRVERPTKYTAVLQQHDEESKSFIMQNSSSDPRLRDERFIPHREAKTFFILENGHNQSETCEPSSSFHEITEGHDENKRTVMLPGQERKTEDESYSEIEQNKNTDLGSQQKEGLVHELENEERERQTLPLPSKEMSHENFGRNESNNLKGHSPDDGSPVKPFATVLSAEETEIKRQKRFNFGNADIYKRPPSPTIPSAMTDSVPYTRFKKMKTEITEDNRKTYFTNVITMQHSDEGKKRENQMSGGDNKVSERENQVNKDENQVSKDENQVNKGENQISKGENVQSKIVNQNQENDRTLKSAAERDEDLGQGQGQGSDKMSNNQQLAPSGFRNEHGDDDNRFLAAAHDELTFASLSHRSLRLSNLSVVKNGPRRPSLKEEEVTSNLADGFTSQVEGKARVGASIQTERPNEDKNGQLVADDVLYSIIEQERLSAGSCSDVKSEGIDTVICLDISSSMAGQPINTALEAIRQLINGFENNAIYHDLEENVAIATFGKENKILCHLTNDYGLLRDSLATVTTGGPSPLWLGLALSLAEIKERGGACAMNPMVVRPRIILITDGFASRKNLLEGDDNKDVDAEVVREILSLLNTCRSFTSYMECITTGPFHENILSTLAEGRIFTVNDVDHMTQFFRVQENANDIVKKVISGEFDRDDIDSIVQNSHLGEKAKKELKVVVKHELMAFSEESKDAKKGNDVREPVTENEDAENIHSTASEEDRAEHENPQRNKSEKAQKQSTSEEKVFESSVHSDVSLSSVDAESLPVFGTAVFRNTDTRQLLTGTVIGTRKKGLVKVLWSDGTMENCKYGIKEQYDVKVLEDQSIDSREIHIGSIVTRGKDWRWKDQDGGEGNKGVVLKIDGPVVHVFWSHGGQGNYRYGYKEKYDLNLSKTRFTDAEGTNCVWFIQDEDEQWRPFPNDVSQSIEKMYKTNCTTTFLVKTGEYSLRISIPKFQARDTNTNSVYSIERRELSRKELLAVTAEQ